MAKTVNILYDFNCSSPPKPGIIEEILEDARPASYLHLKKLIRKSYPELYEHLSLDLYNPWHSETAQTKDYYVLVHSAIEYFFKKIKI